MKPRSHDHIITPPQLLACRLCGTFRLAPVINWGPMAQTGRFPKVGEAADWGPLDFVQCQNQECQLFQSAYLYDPKVFFNGEYGYRSGQNSQMSRHLEELWLMARRILQLTPDQGILDIGANDGTFLHFAEVMNYRNLVAVDPLAHFFGTQNKSAIRWISDFFGAHFFDSPEKFHLISTLAMFYDLNDPMVAAKAIKKLLHPQGLWLVECMTLQDMVRLNLAEGLCHEHLACYDLKQWKYLASKVGLTIHKVERTDTNGGSLLLFMGHDDGPYAEDSQLSAMLKEQTSALTLWPGRIEQKVKAFKQFLDDRRKRGPVVGLGASTKGNIWLQLAQVSIREIVMIGEINTDKWGRTTPGTWIPIVPEEQVLKDFSHARSTFIIFPWHLRKSFEAKLKNISGDKIYGLGTSEFVDAI
ncbi:MAG TPA: hypothetical protein DCY86_12205 [Bdellovibrionales bacterium]|nr:hypothetical protein [Bdellovibrionales bacterium]